MLYQTNNPHGGDIYGGEVLLGFSANTNPLGTPEGVKQAVRDSLEQMDRYPDPYCRRLVQAISRFEGVAAERILCGNGAAELIYSYCEAANIRLGVELAPTFSEYALGLTRMGGRMERYRLSRETEFSLEEGFLDFVGKVQPDAVFLCNPNNPTGKTIPRQLLEKVLAFCREHQIRLFVDECFADLSDREESLKDLLEENPHLFLLKAFTKSYGMAGIRLGYCLCADEALLTRMAHTVQPWNVSSLAQAAGVAALEAGNFLKTTRSLIQTERVWLGEQLEELGFWVCPSETNYLLFQGPETLHRDLKARKITIRNCDNYYGLGPGWYRTAVRRREENQVLIQAIREVLGKE